MSNKFDLFSETSVTLMCNLLIDKLVKETEDIYWRHELITLKQMFKTFFSGDIPLDISLYVPDEKHKDLIETKFRFFREVYTQAYDNWYNLKDVLNTINLNEQNYFYEYPGEFLSGVLAEEYKIKCDKSELTKSRGRTLYLASNELMKGISNNFTQTSKGKKLMKKLSYRQSKVEITLIAILNEVIPIDKRKLIENLNLELFDKRRKLIRNIY